MDASPPLICSLWGKVVHASRIDGGPLQSRRPLSRTHQPKPREATDAIFEAIKERSPTKVLCSDCL